MRFEGEQEALDIAAKIGSEWGFGNVINHLKNTWSKKLVEDHGFTKDKADAGALHVCPWCHVDGRTEKIVK